MQFKGHLKFDLFTRYNYSNSCITHSAEFLIHELIVGEKKKNKNSASEHIFFFTFIMHHCLPKMTMAMDQNMGSEANQADTDKLHDHIRHSVAS